MRAAALMVAFGLLSACASGGDTRPATSQRASTTATSPTTLAPTTVVLPPATTAPVVDVPYRIEVRSSDPALAGFPAEVNRVLGDPRGWQRGGFRLREDPTAEFRIVLAEPDDAQQLCRPYDVYRKYSCQNGPVVVINADRWRHATPQWTGGLATYRVMLVNHEVGHLLGMPHPEVQCPGPGQPAPIMAQQSTELRGCAPNPWPLDHEIERVARHDLPLAPPYER